MPLNCRFYSQKFPEVDDVVMVNVRSIAEMGAYVHLLEYNNIEGIIPLFFLSLNWSKPDSRYDIVIRVVSSSHSVHQQTDSGRA